MSEQQLRAAIEAEIRHASDNGHVLDRDCQGVGPGDLPPAVRVDALRAALARIPDEGAADTMNERLG